MDETQSSALNQLRMAFKSLAKSVDKSLMTQMYTGAGDVAVRSYRALHKRAIEVVPDDYFVREVLDLELPADAPDGQKLSAVSLQANQMVDYLDSLQKPDVRVAFAGPDMDELRNLGRDLQDQILSVTRNTLKRAMANIDISMPKPPAPPESPAPPEAPAPPEPPKGKRKIDIEYDEEYVEDEDDLV